MTPPLRAVLVDDEPLARALLAELLAETPEVEVVGEAATPAEAVPLVGRLKPDVLFLDIEMPGGTGFDVLQSLTALPHVVFTTAYDQHAVRAFETGAVDYLLKPFARSRFRRAIDRVVQRAREQRPALDAEALEALARAARPGLGRLLVRVGDRLVAVDPEAVLWVEAAGNYARLHTAETSYLSSVGLGELAERLDPRRFLRVHRSAVIAVPALRGLRSDGSGGYFALLEAGHRVRVSRTYADRLRDLMV